MRMHTRQVLALRGIRAYLPNTPDPLQGPAMPFIGPGGQLQSNASGLTKTIPWQPGNTSPVSTYQTEALPGVCDAVTVQVNADGSQNVLGCGCPTIRQFNGMPINFPASCPGGGTPTNYVPTPTMTPAQILAAGSSGGSASASSGSGGYSLSDILAAFGGAQQSAAPSSTVDILSGSTFGIPTWALIAAGAGLVLILALGGKR